MGQRPRIRQHVNPLGAKYLVPRARRLCPPSNLSPDCLVEVELGCADGQFAFELARRAPERWVVGLDIRETVIRRNQERAIAEGLENLVFEYVNLNVDLDRVFPDATVDRFHLLFPDPWFKDKHRKRRAVDGELTRLLCRQLRPGGELHLASDVFDVALDAMAALEHPEATALGLHNVFAPWSFARRSPVTATSAREETTLRRGQRIWRLRYGFCGTSWVGAGNATASDNPTQRS